jgi:hypothetical protein
LKKVDFFNFSHTNFYKISHQEMALVSMTIVLWCIIWKNALESVSLAYTDPYISFIAVLYFILFFCSALSCAAITSTCREDISTISCKEENMSEWEQQQGNNINTRINSQVFFSFFLFRHFIVIFCTHIPTHTHLLYFFFGKLSFYLFTFGECAWCCCLVVLAMPDILVPVKV